MSLPDAFISHVTIARVRFRVPSERGHPGFFSKARRLLKSVDGVADVIVNPATGSILVKHATTLEALAEAAEEKGLFNLSEVDADAARTQHFPELLPDLGRMLTPILLGLALMQLLRGRSLGPASGLLWMALALLQERYKAGRGDQDHHSGTRL